MRIDQRDQGLRLKGRQAKRRRVVGIATLGAVLASGLSALPPAVAALPAGGAGLSQSAIAGMLPAALPAGTAGVGPIDPTNGYPYWYADGGDADKGLEPIRLELCLDTQGCPVIGVEYDPSQPLAIPGNFPEESFWWSGETSLVLPGGAEARLIMAQEAAFGGVGAVAQGQQNGFGRVRIRLDDGAPGQQYTFTHPYGVEVLTADDRGRIRFTEDIGCLQQPCSWDEPAKGRVGPFLRWDPAVQPLAPEGFIGDPNVEHEVVGSPYNTDYFQVTGPGTGGNVTARTNQFAVQGKLATLKAGVDKAGGPYNSAQAIKIQASLPDAAKIIYTTDGTDPRINEDGTVNGTEFIPAKGDLSAAAIVELATPGPTTLKYMAVDLESNDKASAIYTENYELDASRPWLEATPDAGPGPLKGPQNVTLTGTTNDPARAPKIYYTMDGSAPEFTSESEPVGSTREYTAPIPLGMSATIRAVAVDPETGTPGEVRSFPFKVHNLSGIGPVGDHGFPMWLKDNGWEGQDPVQLDLCLDDPLCPVVDDRPDPTQPTSWPDNFPGEAFWFASDAEVTIGGEDVRLTLGSEAAFGADSVQENAQVGFGRVRIRGLGVFEPGAKYRFTHPYGTLDLTADVDGNINYTEDLGALNATGDFSAMLEGRIGPFLRWTEGAPEGYLGDGATPHAVTGSPYSTNFFRIEQIANASGDALGNPMVLGETNEFVVQGRTTGATPPDLTAPTVTAATAGGLFAADQLVALTPTPDTAQIFFTTDGTDPTTASTLYTEPIAITAEGVTTIKFIAVNNGVASDTITETFTLDKTAPVLTANVDGGEVPADTAVILSAEENASIFFTLDGTVPTADSTSYAAPVQLAAGQTLRAIAIDGAGNASSIGSWTASAATGGETPGGEPPVNPPVEVPAEQISSGRDFTGDSKADVIATDTAGKLWLYAGDGNGRFAPRKQIGQGWNIMTSIVAPGDFNGDGKNDLVARDTAGNLWLYPSDGNGRFAPRKQIGQGWNIMTSIVAPGDFNGDGKNDLISRDATGNLWLYPSDGNGRFAPRKQIGWGWNSMTLLMGPGDFSGDGKNDLISRDRAGNLWLYGGKGDGHMAPRKQIGWGWNIMNKIF